VGPKRRQLARQVGVLLRVDKYFPVEFEMDNLQQPLQPGTVLRFGSLEFMSPDGSYDMVLLLEICPRDNHRDEHISLYP
jgi:hypothetical protein